MNKKQINELLKINKRFLYTHRVITGNDIKNIEHLQSLIELTRDETTPKAGDIVKLTTEHGDYYGTALISNVWGEPTDNDIEFEVCECPYTPFMGRYDEKTQNIKMSVSGGSFHNFKRNMFQYAGKGKRKFCDWGHCGACGDGAIDFFATVNVWEVKENNRFAPYTTEKYNKMYIYKLDKPSDYGYIIKGDGIAFKTQKDYEAFLKTYKAKEFKGYYNNQTIIFCYKEENFYLTKEEWNKLEKCQIDTRLCNGSIITVKVKYDNRNKKIKVYRYSNRFEPEEEIANKPYILSR